MKLEHTITYNKKTKMFDLLVFDSLICSCATYHDCEVKYDDFCSELTVGNDNAIDKLNDKSLLLVLRSSVAYVTGDFSFVSIAELPIGVFVPVKTSDIRSWCINRLVTRLNHKNKSVRRQGGISGVSVIRRLA